MPVRMTRRGLVAALGGLVLLTGLPASNATLQAASKAAARTFVVGRADGAVLAVTVNGDALAGQRLLMRGGDRLLRIPTQVRGHSLTLTSARGDETNVSVLDLRTRRTRAVSSDGRSAQLLVSPDGRHHYVSVANADGDPAAIVRTDARGTSRRSLLSPADGQGLSGMALSADGRTIYVARTAGDLPSELLAIDTATGAATRVAYVAPYLFVVNVVVSPDGSTLGVTVADDLLEAYRVGVVRAAGGPFVPVRSVGDLHASAFSRDGTALLATEWREQGTRLVTVDTTTLAVTTIAGTDGLRNAVPLA